MTAASRAPDHLHGSIDAGSRSSSRTVFTALVVASVMMCLGLALRLPNLAYDGPPSTVFFANYMADHLSYSDIPYLFFRDGLSRHPVPYLDYQFEYPVGTGLLVYVLNFTRTMPVYFAATSLFLAACGLVTAFLISGIRGSRVWVFALAPALAFYVNLNWDLWSIVFVAGSLLFFMRQEDLRGTTALAVATWTKFFPIVLLPIIMIARTRQGRWEEAGLIGVGFALVSLIINAPLLLVRPREWFYFFQFNQSRPPQFNLYNLWTLVDSTGLSVPEVNRWSAALLIAGIAVIAAAAWLRPHALLPLCCAAIAWFFFVNKVYSPQYSIWIAALLAIIGVAPTIAVLWAITDCIFFAAVSLGVGVPTLDGGYLRFAGSAVLPATAVREAVLLVIVAWCLWRAWRYYPLYQPLTSR